MAPGAAEAAGCGGGGRRGTLCCTVVPGRAAGADVSREDATRRDDNGDNDDNGDRGRLPGEECIAVDTVLPKGFLTADPSHCCRCRRVVAAVSLLIGSAYLRPSQNTASTSRPIV